MLLELTPGQRGDGDTTAKSELPLIKTLLAMPRLSARYRSVRFEHVNEAENRQPAGLLTALELR